MTRENCALVLKLRNIGAENFYFQEIAQFQSRFSSLKVQIYFFFFSYGKTVPRTFRNSREVK